MMECRAIGETEKELSRTFMDTPARCFFLLWHDVFHHESMTVGRRKATIEELVSFCYIIHGIERPLSPISLIITSGLITLPGIRPPVRTASGRAAV